MTRNLLPVLLAASLAASVAAGQEQPSYAMPHYVIAAGGTKATNGSIVLEGTIGQALAGTTSIGGPFGLHGGFWYADSAGTTAATASITGFVRYPVSQVRIRRGVRISLTDTFTGQIRTVAVGKAGRYRFDDVEVGRVYVLRAEGRGVTFQPDSLVINFLDSMADVDFTAVLPEGEREQ
jgi:hypothetical protein